MLLALCVGNSPVTGGFPSQRPVTRNLDVFVDLRLNKWLNKQSRRRWFETPSHWLWLCCNVQEIQYGCQLVTGLTITFEINFMDSNMIAWFLILKDFMISNVFLKFSAIFQTNGAGQMDVCSKMGIIPEWSVNGIENTQSIRVLTSV